MVKIKFSKGRQPERVAVDRGQLERLVYGAAYSRALTQAVDNHRDFDTSRPKDAERVRAASVEILDELKLGGDYNVKM